MDQMPQPASPDESGFRAFRSFQSPPYRFFLPGSLFQFSALSMQIVTGPLFMYRLTGSTAALGIMSLITSLPMIFVSMYGGVIADRFSKKKIIILGTLGSAVVSTVFALLIIQGVVVAENPWSRWLLIAAMLLLSTFMGVMMPSLQAIVAEIVPREMLMNGVALNTMGMNILALVGPAVAGVLIDNVGFHAVYFAMTGVFICSALLMLGVRVITAPRPAAPSRQRIWHEVGEGFRYMWRNPVLAVLLGFSLLATVLSMPYQQLLPVFVDDILHVGATGAGVLMSVSGAGALIGSVSLTMMPNRKRGLMLLLSGVLAGLALIGFSFSAVWGFSLAMMAFLGIGQTFRQTVGSTLLQIYAEPEYRGRVMSIFGMQWGLMGLVTFVAGVAAERFPVQIILGTLAGLLVLASVLAILRVPLLRKLD